MVLARNAKGVLATAIFLLSLFQIFIFECELRRLRQINNRISADLSETKKLMKLRQFQLNLIRPQPPGTIFGTSCKWRPRESECVDFLSKRITNVTYHTKSYSNTSKRWAFFGDSTMKLMMAQYALARINQSAQDRGCQCQFNKTAPRCDMYEVLGLTKKESAWTYPVRNMEGPLHYGLDNPHCQDCSGCNSELVECESSRCNYTTISYLGVEFARDVTMQTSDTTTTQGTIAKYLQNQQCLSDPFICVVNTGLHDMCIEGLSDVGFVNNVAWYFSKLKPCCQHLIWLQTTSVLDMARFPQNNARVERWNSLVQQMMQEELFRNWTSIIDPYEVSRTWSHFDNVHLMKNYYEEIAAFFSRVIEKSSS